MIEYAWQSPEWKASDGRRGHESCEMWKGLMGLDSVYRSSWQEEFAPVVVEMKPLFERWAELDLHTGSSALAFIAFVRTPAGRELSRDALVWLAAASRRGTDFWTER